MTDGNKLGAHWGCAIADALFVNRTLTDVSLKDNNLDERAGEMLVTAYAEQANLLTLELTVDELGADVLVAYKAAKAKVCLLATQICTCNNTRLCIRRRNMQLRMNQMTTTRWTEHSARLSRISSSRSWVTSGCSNERSLVQTNSLRLTITNWMRCGVLHTQPSPYAGFGRSTDGDSCF
jgi:hypothetical protein